MKAKLPFSVVQVLNGPDWAGGALVQLDELVRPSSEDIRLNSPWIEPFLHKFPKVQSGFFIVDVLLMMDKLFFGKMLKCTEPNDVKSMKRTRSNA